MMACLCTGSELWRPQELMTVLELTLRIACWSAACSYVLRPPHCLLAAVQVDGTKSMEEVSDEIHQCLQKVVQERQKVLAR